jgi:hypothetical protein
MRCAFGIALLLACVSCAHEPGATHPSSAGTPANGTGVTPLVPDSATVALWPMDEQAGNRVIDVGPSHLDGVAGQDARPDYGRFAGARRFTGALNSFVFVGAGPALDTGTLTIEAWVRPTDFGAYEDTPIAARWVETSNDLSWLFSIVGRRNPHGDLPGPHAPLVQRGSPGVLMFVYQPQDAGQPLPFFSSRPLEQNRWTHVAATFDGAVVRIWIDGQVDAQYATPGRIRSSQAPLIIGNAFDPRELTTFGGELRMGPTADPTPYYAFVGQIDEVRLSSAARASFPYARGR